MRYNHRFPFVLAVRYLRSKHVTASIRTMSLVSIFGITIGTAALTLVLAIMHGFNIETRARLQSIHPPLLMHAEPLRPLAVDAIQKVIDTEYAESVSAVSPFVLQHAVIQPTEDDEPIVVAVKGINPHREIQISTIHHKIICPKDRSFSSLFAEKKVVIGAKLAQQLDVLPGDSITLAIPHTSGKRISLETNEVSIRGIFKTGVEESDAHLILCSLEAFSDLFPDSGLTHIGILPRKNPEKTAQELHKRFNLAVYSWQELYPAIVSALKLEEYAMFLILALITAVASMMVIAVLYMHITAKQRDIAVLRSCGVPSAHIKHIFIWIGLCITSIASITGISIACLAALFMQHYPLITLPDAYFVSHLPVIMCWWMPVLVFSVALVLGVCATIFATRGIHNLPLHDVLRSE